jgi:hypothetical protein
MYAMSALPDLEPVPEGVGNVKPPCTRDRVVEDDDVPGSTKPPGELLQVVRHEPGVCLARRRKCLLDADVELLWAGPEPAAAARRERFRLRDLLEAEQAS